MARYIVQIPKNYESRFQGNRRVTVEASSPHMAKVAVVKRNVPYALLADTTPVEIKGEIVEPYGNYPINLADIPFDPTARGSYNTALGAAQPISVTAGSTAEELNWRMNQPFYSGEESSGNNFAPNINPPPTWDDIQQAIPYTLGSPQDPFSQPPAYKPLTTEDFRRIRQKSEAARKAAESTEFDAKAFFGGAYSGGTGSSTGNSASAINNMVANQTQDQGKGKGKGSFSSFDKAAGSTEFDADAFFGGAYSTAKEDDSDKEQGVSDKDRSRNFDETLQAIKSGEINLYTNGTFGITPFEDSGFWDAVFQELPEPKSQADRARRAQNPNLSGDTQMGQFEAMAKQIAESAPDDFEANRALTAFYRLAALQLNARGMSNLRTSSGRTIAQFVSDSNAALATPDKEWDDSSLNTDLELQLDSADAASSDPRSMSDRSIFDFGSTDESADIENFTGGGAIGGEGEGFFPVVPFNPNNPPNQNNQGNQFPPRRPAPPNVPTQAGDLISIQDIIDSFELVNPGQKVTYQVPLLDEDGIPIPGAFNTVVNPLLASLLDSADLNNGFITQQSLAEAQNLSAVEIAEIQKAEALAVAYAQGASAEAVAKIQSDGDYNIALAREKADKYIAQQQLAGTRATAGAASPFGFIQQGGTTEQLANIYSNLNEVGLAEAAAAESQAAAAESQAQAARLAAQGNIFSFAAGQEQFDPNQLAQIAANSPEAFAARGQVDAATVQADAQRDIARIQSSVGLDQNQKDYLIAQVNSDAQRAVAAIQSAAQQSVAATQAAGQIGAAQAGASGFGALLSGDTAVNQQANAILRAQQANNPYAVAQLGDVEQSRIDQILRGGLTAEQRLAEIRASQEAQNFANQLNFIGNPSAVGFASERGLLQDISDSPEGNIPGSLFGFNAPSATGAGGGQTTNVGNYNLNTLRNASDEQIGFLQGAASAQGMTPSEFQDQVEAFTPQGV